MDGIVFNLNSGQWVSDAGTFYWPKEGDLNFYSYAPEKPGETGEFSVTPSEQKLTGFTPFSTADTQQDFIYAKATGNYNDNATSGVDLNFSHALSEITVAAKNDNKAYTVEVTGVKVGNVTSKGDFTFPTLDGSDAAWTLGSDKATYTTTWNEANPLSSVVSNLDASNTAFMLIPQQLEASDKAADGNYIALKIKLTMQGGKVMYEGWSYVAVPTLWEMNKHYHYTLDYSNGAGQDENGNEIISGTGIKFNVTVTPWDEENYKLPCYATIKYVYDRFIPEISIKLGNERITIPSNTSGVATFDLTNVRPTSLAQMTPSNCIEFNCANYDATTVVSTAYMFGVSSTSANEKSVKVISIPNWKTSNVTDMGAMFLKCAYLKSLDMSGWNTSNVTNMAAMFAYCRSLTSLDLSGWDTSNVTNMAGMFAYCSSLTSLDLSGWNVNNVETWDSIGKFFDKCTNLKTIYMVGCDEATINKIKTALTSAGLSTDIVKTTK